MTCTAHNKCKQRQPDYYQYARGKRVYIYMAYAVIGEHIGPQTQSDKCIHSQQGNQYAAGDFIFYDLFHLPFSIL